MNRRSFLKNSSALGAAMAAGALLPARSARALVPGKSGRRERAIILGMDGMDPVLLKRFTAEGRMPTFKKCMESWRLGELRTVMPPHSPVAWASFITGTNPGGHGIFDFVHRDPATFTPYMSTSRSFAAEDALKLGNWQLPLGSGEVKLMRRGRAFWSVLEEQGVPASIFQIPANFPVEPGASRMISGMGTPDLLGTYGTFTYITDSFVRGGEDLAGGRVVKVRVIDHKTTARLEGPVNAFRSDQSKVAIELGIRRDPGERVIKVDLQGQTVILKEGEWSEWLPVHFEQLPFLLSTHGMVRLYAKEIHPRLKLYVSPINVDPLNASLPISNPPEYCRELAQSIGRFYTQGFPADTKMLSSGIFSSDEYLAQAKLVLEENLKAFEYELERFSDGCFFFYFSNLDQNTHMLWRLMDPAHPLYDARASSAARDAIGWFYEQMDKVLARALGKVNAETLLMVLSDHGFAPFTREFHLSSWLVERGYTVLTHPEKMHESQFFDYVDWEKTQAYALGINGIYINQKGREKHGSVSETAAIKGAISRDLSELVDPLNGRRVVSQVYDPAQIFSGPYAHLAPDLVVGYERGYRISDEAVLGKFPRGIIGDRKDPWSADHCIDCNHVPGILLTNRPWLRENPSIEDLAPTILRSFGLEAPPEMTGRALL